MTARPLPTMPSFLANSELTSTQLTQLVTATNFWANPPSFRAEQHTTQNITSTPNLQVTCETVIHDSDGGLQAVSPYSYVIPYAGYWDLAGAVSLAANATGWRAPSLLQNGTIINGSQTQFPAGPATGNTFVPTNAPGVYCNVGDVIGLWIDQNSGSTLATIVNGSQSSYFTGTLKSLATP